MSASLSITFFIMVVAGIFLTIPFIVPRLKERDVMSLILRRCSFIVGIFLMMFNAAIVATIADTASIGVTEELFRYMWIIGRAGWIFVLFTMIKTLFDVLKLWKIQTAEKRMGDRDG